MAHPPGECAGVECTMDLGAQFCERCGRDRDSFASARSSYRDCPACGAACCTDCWNQVDGACLACAPFRLADATARPRIVIEATPVAAASADPYADLRAGAPTVDAWSSRAAARQRPRDAEPAGRPIEIAPDAWRTVVAAQAAEDAGATPQAVPPRRPRRRAGRFGLAAAAAWVVVVALSVAALGATPGRVQPAPAEVVTPSPIAATPVPSPTPAPAATVRPTREPRATPTRRATPAPVVGGGTTGTPRATPKATPKPTKKPTKPVVVAPPPVPTPAPTPEPTPDLSPEATPGS